MEKNTNHRNENYSTSQDIEDFLIEVEAFLSSSGEFNAANSLLDLSVAPQLNSVPADGQAQLISFQSLKTPRLLDLLKHVEEDHRN